jgi:hypothetical protein
MMESGVAGLDKCGHDVNWDAVLPSANVEKRFT